MSKNKETWSDYFDFSTNRVIPFPLPQPFVQNFVLDNEAVPPVDKKLPLLVCKNSVVFPQVAMPFDFSNPAEKALINEIQSKTPYYFYAVYESAYDEEDKSSLVGSYAVLCHLVRMIATDDGSSSAIVLGLKRVRITKISSRGAFPKAEAVLDEEVMTSDEKSEVDERLQLEVFLSEIRDIALKNLSNRFDRIPTEVVQMLRESDDPTYLLNFATSSCSLKPALHYQLLSVNSVLKRAEQLLALLYQEQKLFEIREEVRSVAREDMERQQKDYFLQQQIRVMQEELGGGSVPDSISEELRLKALGKKWPSEVEETFFKELRRLDNLNPHSPDFSVQHQYLESLLELPWNEFTKDNFSLNNAERVLNRDHFGLDKVKERILEHIAVLRLRKDMKSPILCLWGPPGVGKTSLGKSIADSLGRKYIRISLGGLHDEAEIRGHRRTYIGAMPGRIMQAIKKAGTSNPVIVLDEIDKIDASVKGDPSAALLEVLDPEQNKTFHDNYVDVDYDLSNVLFIATANSLSSISRPLLDRMELIPVTGYIAEEKLEIARKHLVPKQLEEHGVDKKFYSVKFPKAVLEFIIESYTRESGVRGLEKQIATCIRKFARNIKDQESYHETLTVASVKEYLGVPPFTRDIYQGNDYYGVVTGLAWTSVGGEILFIESSLHKGKDCRLTLTGNLGDVMKESATIALSYIRAHAAELGITPEQLSEQELHIHVPEGAIPKDGPSAGITMLTSIVSAFTKRKVRHALAMTGEITLRGRVLPVGGIKEKILAAKRSGITDIILSEENKKNIEEIKEMYRKGVTFHYVNDVSEVLRFALLPEEV